MTNLGVKPLGRSDEISEVVQHEINCLKEFKTKLFSILPIASAERAAQYRQIITEYYNKLSKNGGKSFSLTCKSLGLSS